MLRLADNKKSTETLGSILSIGNLKACPYSDILLPTRPYTPTKSNKVTPPSNANYYKIMGTIILKLSYPVLCFWERSEVLQGSIWCLPWLSHCTNLCKCFRRTAGSGGLLLAAQGREAFKNNACTVPASALLNTQ